MSLTIQEAEERVRKLYTEYGERTVILVTAQVKRDREGERIATMDVLTFEQKIEEALEELLEAHR